MVLSGTKGILLPCVKLQRSGFCFLVALKPADLLLPLKKNVTIALTSVLISRSVSLSIYLWVHYSHNYPCLQPDYET